MKQISRPAAAVRVLDIIATEPRMTSKRIKPSLYEYNAQESFASVTENLCTAEAFFLSKIEKLPEEQLKLVREECLNMQRIIEEIRAKISEEIGARYQE